MKKHHTTIVLAIIFATGLITLWWARDTGQDQEVSDAVLPALGRIPQADIQRLEIVQSTAATNPSESKPAAAPGSPRIVLERRPEGRWQMLEPYHAAADPSIAETLVRNLREVRRSPEAGTLKDDPKTFGLAPPETVVRVYGGDGKKLLTALDVGKAHRDILYVRPEGTPGIEVVEPRLFSMLKLAPAQWRDRALFHLPSFRVASLAVTGPGRELKAERDEGHWRLVRPFRAVAEDEKVEGMVAELTSLRVAPGNAGFVVEGLADKDAAKYGLDAPLMSIELVPAPGSGSPQTLSIGKAAEGEDAKLHYARAGGQDDVVLINAGKFLDLGLDLSALRSKKVAEFQPARVEFIRIEQPGRTTELSRSAKGWEQLRPAREPADRSAVVHLLQGLAEAQTSDFAEPAKVPRPELDPPHLTITLWQGPPRTKPSATPPESAPKTDPQLVLHVGRHDVARKSIYARLEGDRSVLVLPDTLADALPDSPLAFRDRRISAFSPAEILRIAVHRDGTSYEIVAPTEAGKSTHWRMVAPVSAPADDQAATRIAMQLADLRAEGFVTDQLGEGKAFGLHAPELTVTWTTPAKTSGSAVVSESAKASEKEANAERPTRSQTLRIGAKRPKSELFYANLEGSPIVFTLPEKTVKVFQEELHTHRIMAFPEAAARRLVLRWPGLSLAFKPQEAPGGKELRWVPEGDADIKGFDLTRIGPLVKTLSELNTPRFLQYQGPIPAETGLTEPRLVIEVHVGNEEEPRVLRIGKVSDQECRATTASGATGPVFVLTGPAWSDLVRHVPGGPELPQDTFAPAGNGPASSPAPAPAGEAKPSPP